MNNDLLYQIALTLIPNIGAVQSKILVDYFGNAENIFKAKIKELSAVEGIGEIRARYIKTFNQFQLAEEEIKFAEEQQIQCLFLTDEHYPKRLLHCYDAPTILYYKGNANLNSEKIVSIIGTRNNTDYGKQITEDIIEELMPYNVLIVSGLAFGIDATAHKIALQKELSTIGVLAHGLDTMYPPQHKSLSKEMLLNGGLLTEFRQNTKPDKFNFPQRNRIVAGMADATIIVETASKGGSMITAELAYNYNRDVFAVPGKIYDTKSSGCLSLIQQNKAVLLAKPSQLIEEMGWLQKKKQPKKQRELFIELSPDEKMIIDIVKQNEATSIDEIYLKSALSSSTVAAAILNLELQNVLISLPGKMYKLRD
ncbi:MAG: DNA-processing protein DprA [Chitinophagaceae bacterium]|nr:DNA-processing protein DprA [Chitinophagaceae bacterium]MCW5905728.1 DNA-processing protein DprA [Chitinophagaceae bacterium]